ncbi:protein Flattop [Indicator indicator]|uniref:protein Flattop n=1 Tax=Indicator indicator TaxID=1002788 RepID=UPI0023DEFB59|nr:protein Flattop [Indicator indicator]
MAARDGAGQYEDAFRPQRLQNWGVPRHGHQRPSPREGPTQIVANDRGHLLPAVPRCQASPWGTFVGTWDMPPRIPPARLDLTSRSAAAAARLLQRSRQPSALTRACNGLRTQVTGKLQQPGLDTQTSKEPSQGSKQAPGEDSAIPASNPAPMTPAPREASPREATELQGSAPIPGGSAVGSKENRNPQLQASPGAAQGEAPAEP